MDKGGLETARTDVLVLGSGAAGLRAAIEARMAGAAVLVASRSKIGRANNSAVSYGGIATSKPSSDLRDCPESHYEDTMEGGRWVNQPHLVKALTENVHGEVEFLAKAGVKFLKEKDGPLRFFARGGHRFARRISTLHMLGSDLTKPLWEYARKLGIKGLPGVTASKIVVRDERFAGVLACTEEGKIVFLEAAALVLATGGAGALYPATTNTAGSVGDGYALAYEAGLPLIDMEFVQFIITPVRERGVPARMPPFEEFLLHGAVLRNSVGKILFADRDPKGVTRAMWLREVAQEIEAGRGVDGCILMDLNGLSPHIRNNLHSGHRRSLPRAGNFLTSNLLPYRPTSHYFMGGVYVDENFRTGCEGMYVAGEAMGGVHGANRLGGNALADTVVFGAVAGRKAAEAAHRLQGDSMPVKELEVEADKLRSLLAGKAHAAELEEVRHRLKRVMLRYGGVVRDGEGLRVGLRELHILEGDVQQLRVAEARQLPSLLALEKSIQVGRIILECALARQESRGAHYRRDYPEEADGYLHKSIRIIRGKEPTLIGYGR